MTRRLSDVLSEEEQDFILDGLREILARKRDACDLLRQAQSMPRFTEADFAIPKIEALIARFEAEGA